MNIDIVNKQVSRKLGINEKKVTLVNKFYWDCIKQHIYSYNPNPVNIDSVCVLYPAHWLIKDAILHYVAKIRKLKKKNSLITETYNVMLRHFWNMRKVNKFTN